MDALATVIILAAMGIVSVLIIGALLVRFGCYMTGVESPSLGRAVAVVLLSMVLGFFVNIFLAVGAATLVASSGVDPSLLEKGKSLWWAMRGAQLVSDSLVFGSVSSALLKGVTFGKGVLIGLMIGLSAIALGIAAGAAVGGMLALQR